MFDSILKSSQISSDSQDAFPLFSLPIETLNRELLAKVLLAGKAVDRGWALLFGSQTKVCQVMRRCPPGVHLEISIPARKYETRLKPLSQAGHQLTCLCEEGFIYHDGDVYCTSKVGESSLGLLKLFFATGQRQADDVCAHRQLGECRLLITGNPRFDLLHWPCRAIYSDDVRSIRDQIGGPFVLFNSNLTIANPHPSYGNLLQMLVRSGRVVTDRQQKIVYAQIASARRLITDYQRIISDLATSGLRVVIRPHPSENHEFWKEFAASVSSRIHVFHTGSANAWSLAADLVIHTGCTTGLEAFLMKRPVITYLPDYLADDSCVTNRLGFQVSSPEQLLDTAMVILRQQHTTAELDTDGADAERKALALHRVANSEEPFACDRILDALARLTSPHHPLPLLRSCLRRCRRSFSRRVAASLVRQLLLALPEQLLLPSMRTKKSKYLLDWQKFSGLTRDELLRLFERFHALGLIQTVPNVESVDTDIFLLFPNST